MPRLSASVTSGGVSSLLRSSSSLQNSISAYEDSLQAFNYSNSAYTDEAYAGYKSYLEGRINSLNAAGGITNAQKALTLTKTLEGATKSNISASISRENIDIMTGNATLNDKLDLVGRQFSRAESIGDDTLAQSLMGQYYSISQQIQYQNQQASAARTALQTAQATQEGDIVTNLKDSVKYFEGIAKNSSENELNKTLKDFVKTNAATFEALGVKVDSQQPNYFDVVSGIAGAVYNHTVLQAQAESPINPLRARDLAMQAQEILNGTTKFQTLAGSLTFQQIQQASQDPSMLAYDSSTGKYKITEQAGYQYQTFTDPTGKSYQALVPRYSGIVGGINNSKVNFLTPNETKLAVQLGLKFTQKGAQTAVSKGQQVGVGVEVQLGPNSPQWLKSILGNNGTTRLFTDRNGDIAFAGAAKSGSGQSYYTLVSDGRGLAGLFEHQTDGSIKLAGGEYGFNAGAASMLVNQAQTVQRDISLQQQMHQMELKLAPPPRQLPNISIAPVKQLPTIQQPHPAIPQIRTGASVAPQTLNPQAPQNTTFQGGSIKIQGGSASGLTGIGAGIHL